MNLMETLKRKLGPLPVWAWLGLFVLLLSYYFIRKRKQQEAAAAAAQAEQDQNSTSGSSTSATNLGSNSLSNLVPTAYPMPFQQGDVFTTVQVPASTGTATTTTQGTTTTQQPATPSGPKYPNQVHRVGQVGQMYDLKSYIKQWYPNLTPQELTEVEFATIVDPKNAQYNLGTGKIPGGAMIEIYSAGIK